MTGYSRRVPDQGLYGPGSVTWRLNRERVLLLGGQRALVMQVAHPRIAAGVDDHSDFRERPLRRLARTYVLSLDAVFGDTPTALGAIGRINERHAGVRGLGYSARDPELLAWVWATLVDSSVLSYELFVTALTDGEKEAFYRETGAQARLLGTPDGALPRDFAGLRAYVDEMVRTELRADATVRGVVGDTLYPPRLRHLWPLLATQALVTTGLLPARLRAELGLPWSLRRRAAFELLVRAVRSTVPRLPRALREVPQARDAWRRVA